MSPDAVLNDAKNLVSLVTFYKTSSHDQFLDKWSAEANGAQKTTLAEDARKLADEH